MTETIDDLTINYEENGIEVVKELDKVVLSKGAWTTILYRYQEWDAKQEKYGPDKFSIRRYQKWQGSYRQKSKFNISSIAQAEKIIATLTNWIAATVTPEED